MPSAKKKKNAAAKAATRQVPLSQRSILDGLCSMLVPGPITNSGKADGGWMDRVGITNSGLGHIFERPAALAPIECFYSNDAYAKPGFCTMHLELHPPLECIGDTSTRETLTEYLLDYLRDSENDYYRRGEYWPMEAPDIDDPASIGSAADMIVHTAFEVTITPGPNLPAGLTAKTRAALIHFAGKGNVLFKANNFDRHKPPLDYTTLLGSILYTASTPYHGSDPNLSGIRGMMAFARTGSARRAAAVTARARTGGQPTAGAVDPSHCLACGAATCADGTELLQCARCKRGRYCSTGCQRKDWKRHKRTDCRR